MLKLFFAILIFQQILPAQITEETSNIPRDTSFTIFSTYMKEREKFPFIKIVNAKSAEGIYHESNVIYNSSEHRNLHLDIFYPKVKTRLFPAIVLLHGGGWRSGDKSQQIPMAIEIAKAGFVTAAIEYRLSPEAKYPAAVYDIKSAIRWLRADGTKYSLDTNKIAVLGCSSGGHLAALVGVTNDNEKFEGMGNNLDHSSRIQAAIDIDGILDFTHPAESGKDSDPEKPSVGKLWLGALFKENPKIWEEASPINYVDKNLPPFLFINSSIDRFQAGRDILIDKLNQFQTYSEVHTFPDTPHAFWFFHPWFNSTNKMIIDFLNYVFNYFY